MDDVVDRKAGDHCVKLTHLRQLMFKIMVDHGNTPIVGEQLAQRLQHSRGEI
jgi:hypothetical protein